SVVDRDGEALISATRTRLEKGDRLSAFAHLSAIDRDFELSVEQKLEVMALYRAIDETPAEDPLALLQSIDREDGCRLYAFSRLHPEVSWEGRESIQRADCRLPPKHLNDVDANLTRYESPTYPSRALRAGEEGYCALMFDVSPQGRTDNVAIRCTDEVFETSVRRTVRQWRYEPRMVDGEPAWRYNVVTSFPFRLR
ncbi:MAG: energy transducer TonB, partial [Oceanicaulis sp.]